MFANPACASFRFYAELNDHLPPVEQYRTVERDLLVRASVKDMIESFSIPSNMGLVGPPPKLAPYRAPCSRPDLDETIRGFAARLKRQFAAEISQAPRAFKKAAVNYLKRHLPTAHPAERHEAASRLRAARPRRETG